MLTPKQKLLRSKARAYRKRYNKGPEPRFQVGDIAGGFNVIAYLGYSCIHPEIAKKLGQEHHWYRVRCSCKNEEIHTQQQLIDTRRQRVCEDCTVTNEI